MRHLLLLLCTLFSFTITHVYAGGGITHMLIAKEAIAKLVKVALPHHVQYIDKVGEAGYHNLLEELEGRLLDELRKMLAGVEADKASVEQAAEILKRSNELLDSSTHKDIQPSTSFKADVPAGQRP